MKDRISLATTLFDRGLGAHLGFQLASLSETEVIIEWSVGPAHLQPWGLVHGGVYASAVETACSLGASAAAGEGVEIAGIENHTSFLRPVRSGKLTCEARPVHVGRSSHLWEAHITDELGRIVASGRLRVFVLGAVPQ